MIKILVVDDEQKICEFVKAYLDREGYKVTVVYNGKMAIENFEDVDYDLIILDRMLPDISGEEVCKHIRKKSETPIIMLTAKIEDEDRIEGFTLGCDDYLCKPFNVRELVLRVKAILKRNNKLSDNNIIKVGNEVEIDTLSYEVRITIACLYFGLSLFVLFVIKSCYSRTAVIMAILEDQQKKDDIKDFFIKYKKGSDLNERDIELIKIICVSRSEREKTAKHPYEIILKNISGSSLSFGNSKLKVSDEEKK